METELLAVASSLSTMALELRLDIARKTVFVASIFSGLLGLVIATASQFASEYQKKIDEQKSEFQEARRDEIATNLPVLTADAVMQKVIELRMIEVAQGDLRSSFPLGYAILTFQGEDWFALPGSTDFNWDTTKIEPVGGGKVSIRLPNYDDGSSQVEGNIIVVDRIAGTDYPIRSFGLNMLVRVLQSDDQSLQLLVAITDKPPPGLKSKENIVIETSPVRSYTELLRRADRAVWSSNNLTKEQKLQASRQIRLAIGHINAEHVANGMVFELMPIRDLLNAVGGEGTRLVKRVEQLSAQLEKLAAEQNVESNSDGDSKSD